MNKFSKRTKGNPTNGKALNIEDGSIGRTNKVTDWDSEQCNRVSVPLGFFDTSSYHNNDCSVCINGNRNETPFTTEIAKVCN